FGNAGDKPFVGDFDADGVDTVGLHRESSGLVYFRNSNTTGVADSQFIYGDPGDMLVAGDWDGDGDDTIGVYRPSNGVFYLKNSNVQGVADAAFHAGDYAGVVALLP
ncbi:MAG: peptidase C1, partial [Acidimicrobiia bacterium]